MHGVPSSLGFGLFWRRFSSDQSAVFPPKKSWACLTAPGLFCLELTVLGRISRSRGFFLDTSESDDWFSKKVGHLDLFETEHWIPCTCVLAVTIEILNKS